MEAASAPASIDPETIIDPLTEVVAQAKSSVMQKMGRVQTAILEAVGEKGGGLDFRIALTRIGAIAEIALGIPMFGDKMLTDDELGQVFGEVDIADVEGAMEEIGIPLPPPPEE